MPKVGAASAAAAEEDEDEDEEFAMRSLIDLKRKAETAPGGSGGAPRKKLNMLTNMNESHMDREQLLAKLNHQKKTITSLKGKLNRMSDKFERSEREKREAARLFAARQAESEAPKPEQHVYDQLLRDGQRALEAAGFPHLLRYFAAAASRGGIPPSSQTSIFWHLTNDMAKALITEKGSSRRYSEQTKLFLGSIACKSLGAYRALRGPCTGLTSASDMQGSFKYCNLPIPEVDTPVDFLKAKLSDPKVLSGQVRLPISHHYDALPKVNGKKVTLPPPAVVATPSAAAAAAAGPSAPTSTSAAAAAAAVMAPAAAAATPAPSAPVPAAAARHQ